MELWIRNQDKDGLYKVDEVYIDERDYGNNDISYYIRESGVLLGRYTTKKRALEVLDEIQHRLITLCDSMNRHLYVYEMPEE